MQKKKKKNHTEHAQSGKQNLKNPPKTKATEEKLRRLLRPKIFYGFFIIPSTLGKRSGFLQRCCTRFWFKVCRIYHHITEQNPSWKGDGCDPVELVATFLQKAHWILKGCSSTSRLLCRGITGENLGTILQKHVRILYTQIS